MVRLRVYVETSVWSFAFADDAPDYRAATLAFFDQCRAGAVSTFVSQIVLAEIERAREPLRGRLTGLIRGIRPTLLPFPAAAADLADRFVREGIVPAAKPEDARHVAAAIVAELDVLVSWNFRHIVNIRRAERFNAAAILASYVRPLRIASPEEVLYGDEDDADGK